MTIGTNLLKKLHLDKDLSLDRDILEKGHFRHAMKAVSSNMSTVMLINLLFVLFCLPIVFILVAFRPILEGLLTANMNFSGDLGFGFLGPSNDNILGAVEVYKYRMILIAGCIPWFTLAGVGAAGAFYCARNLVWGAKVKIRTHFFRGIKKYWWQFMIAFTIIGVEAAGVACSVIGILMMNVTGVAPWWMYFIAVMTCLITLLTLIFMIIYLPMISQYGGKERFKMKNSSLLSIVAVLPAVIIIIMLAVPTLMLLSSFTMLVFFMFMAIMGFMVYFICITEFSSFCSDNFIRSLYEYKVEQEERDRKKQINQERKTKNKAQGKKKGKR